MTIHETQTDATPRELRYSGVTITRTRCEVITSYEVADFLRSQTFDTLHNTRPCERAKEVAREWALENMTA